MSWFSIFCIVIIGDFLNQSVLACITKYFSESKFIVYNPCWYVVYYSSNISFTNVFWTLFKSDIFWSVKLPSHSRQVYSSIPWKNTFQSSTISGMVDPKLHTLQRSCIIAFADFLILKLLNNNIYYLKLICWYH